jgi:virginiamycin A acetyltransferase
MLISKLRNMLGIFTANLSRRCRVRSFLVSPEALGRETDIQVLRGSSIDASSRIGSHTYIGCYTYITRSKIGRYCSIANNVSIGQGEHCLDRISTSACFYSEPWEMLTAGNCEIASDVWIGVDAVILRGVKVGIGAVIAANAVVTKDVPDYAIVAGVPARLIRYRFPEEEMKTILASRWWELEHEAASTVIRRLEEELKRHEVC